MAMENATGQLPNKNDLVIAKSFARDLSRVLGKKAAGDKWVTVEFAWARPMAMGMRIVQVQRLTAEYAAGLVVEDKPYFPFYSSELNVLGWPTKL